MNPPTKKRNTRRFALVAIVSLVLVACQTPGWKESAQRNIDKTMAQAHAATTPAQAVPSEISEALLPPLVVDLPEGGKAPLGPRFDLTVNNAPARQVFMGLVEATPYSMVVNPEVGGRLTLDLKDVTVPEAVDAIRHAYGYAYRRDGNRFFILGRGMQTQLFKVSYLNFKRTGKSQTRVSPADLRTETNTGSGTGTGSSGIQVETDSQADFWKQLLETISAVVGKEDGRTVAVNPQAGLVIVKAMPGELRVVEQLLDITHASVNRQVILEAKIVEVELNNRFQTGINWSQMGNWDSADITASQIGGGTLLDSGASEIFGNAFTLDPATGSFSGIGSTLTSAFGGIFALTAMSDNFSLFLEALKSQGNVQVLSSPRVATLNNQKAVIKVGADEFFITEIETDSTVSGGITTFSPSVELTPFFSGIALDVTPQIDDSGNIILHMHPAVSDVEERTKNFEISGEPFSLPLAVSSIQESDNVVRAASGQVIVVGGLMKEGVTDENARVPLLGDIPIIGNLFRQKRITRIKKELVILLRPTVINVAQDWADAVKESQDRIKSLSNAEVN